MALSDLHLSQIHTDIAPRRPSQRPPCRQHAPLPARAFDPEEEIVEEEVVEVEDVVEPASLINSNPQFAAVFKAALQRRGKDAVTKGPPEDPK